MSTITFWAHYSPEELCRTANMEATTPLEKALVTALEQKLDDLKLAEENNKRWEEQVLAMQAGPGDA